METVCAGLGSLELDRLNALIGGMEIWRLVRDDGISSEIELEMLGRELRGLPAAEIERRAARGQLSGRSARVGVVMPGRRDEVADRIVGWPGAAPAEALRTRQPEG